MVTLSSLASFSFALSQRGVTEFFRRQFLDTTFKGLYTANAFDMLLLIPYFIVLIFLASYGIHRYVLVYLYYKHKKNAHGQTSRRAAIQMSICHASPCSFPFSTSSSSSTAWWTPAAACTIRRTSC